MNDANLEKRLANLTNGLGPFAPAPDRDYSKLADQMRAELSDIEQLLKHPDHDKFNYEYAIALRNFVAWYVRGDDRKPYLQQVVEHLRLSIDRTHKPEAKFELSRILIEEKQVRDLEEGLSLAAQLTNENQLPEYMSSTVAKAKRWMGVLAVPTDTDFSELDPTPASIQEERTKLRKILVDLIKAGDPKSAMVAKRLYNLGILSVYLYTNFDGTSGVSGFEFEAAQRKFRRIRNRLCFDFLGRIENQQFLSETDYKRIEKILGTTNTKITVADLKERVERELAP